MKARIAGDIIYDRARKDSKGSDEAEVTGDEDEAAVVGRSRKGMKTDGAGADKL